jgi:hypothetical protein
VVMRGRPAGHLGLGLGVVYIWKVSAMRKTSALMGAGGRAGGAAGACVMSEPGGMESTAFVRAAPRKPIHITRLSCCRVRPGRA